MAKIGQVELVTPEPGRWGDGSDGAATWSGDIERAGVYQYTNLTISAGAHVSVIGNSDGRTGAKVNRGSNLSRSLIIFAQNKVEIGNNVIINANPDGTTIGNRKIGEIGNSTTVWGAYNSGAKKEYARGVMFADATWRTADPTGWSWAPSGSVGNQTHMSTDQPNASSKFGMINSGGGGGGSSNNRSLTGSPGQASDGVRNYLRYTNNLGNSVITGDSGIAAGYAIPPVGAGGRHAERGNGAHGAHGTSVDSNTIAILKDQFNYSSVDHVHTKEDGSTEIHDRDSFPIAYGGDGGPGGGYYSKGGYRSLYRRGLKRIALGGHGGGQIVIIAPQVIFPDAPVPATNGPIPEVAHGNSITWTSRSNYTSNAALLYACGQTRSPGVFGNDVPGSNAQSPSEEGIGGSLSGGTGQWNGLNGRRVANSGYTQGSSGGGGGGGGGCVIIVYNKFKGHPTIRTYGGLGGTDGVSATRTGGSGGRGGDGVMLIGWKAKQKGPITWVKQSNYGMRRGVIISSLASADRRNEQAGGDHTYDHDGTGPREEQYDGYQWPKLLNGEYAIDSPDGFSTLDYVSGGAGAQADATGSTQQQTGGSISNTGTGTGYSDIRLKDNIEFIGTSDLGLKIYEFDYINKLGRYQGVMAQDLLEKDPCHPAVTIDNNGYYMVDYNKIDVEFKNVLLQSW